MLAEGEEDTSASQSERASPVAAPSPPEGCTGSSPEEPITQGSGDTIRVDQPRQVDAPVNSQERPGGDTTERPAGASPEEPTTQASGDTVRVDAPVSSQERPDGDTTERPAGASPEEPITQASGDGVRLEQVDAPVTSQEQPDGGTDTAVTAGGGVVATSPSPEADISSASPFLPLVSSSERPAGSGQDGKDEEKLGASQDRVTSSALSPVTAIATPTTSAESAAGEALLMTSESLTTPIVSAESDMVLIASEGQDNVVEEMVTTSEIPGPQSLLSSSSGDALPLAVLSGSSLLSAISSSLTKPSGSVSTQLSSSDSTQLSGSDSTEQLAGSDPTLLATIAQLSSSDSTLLSALVPGSDSSLISAATDPKLPSSSLTVLSSDTANTSQPSTSGPSSTQEAELAKSTATDTVPSSTQESEPTRSTATDKSSVSAASSGGSSATVIGMPAFSTVARTVLTSAMPVIATPSTHPRQIQQQQQTKKLPAGLSPTLSSNLAALFPSYASKFASTRGGAITSAQESGKLLGVLATPSSSSLSGQVKVVTLTTGATVQSASSSVTSTPSQQSAASSVSVIAHVPVLKGSSKLLSSSISQVLREQERMIRHARSCVGQTEGGQGGATPPRRARYSR